MFMSSTPILHRSTHRFVKVVIVQARFQTTSRHVTTVVKAGEQELVGQRRDSLESSAISPKDGLWRLKTNALIRNIILGHIFSSPRLLRIGTQFLNRVAKSKSGLLNTDSNAILRAVLKPILYKQFCAGVSKNEINETKDLVLSTGYAGIILAYGKELDLMGDTESGCSSTRDEAELQYWTNGNLETLDMIGSKDFLAIKFTGAGTRIIEAMKNNEEPPADFVAALDRICRKADVQGCRLWIDSEYQEVQTAIDRWTVNLMRKYNRDRVLVYNTLQAYLKKSRIKLQHYLRLASTENWHLGIKLVRGAYIENDQRDLIHDTKKDTDKSYNSIVRDLLCASKENLGLANHETFPQLNLFLAGHNPESIASAWELTHKLERAGKLQNLPDFGQLQGMGDQVSCHLLQRAETLAQEQTKTGRNCSIPKIYKYSPWGSVQECMLYLLRRSHENSGGTARMKDGISAYKNELWRRVWRGVWSPSQSRYSWAG